MQKAIAVLMRIAGSMVAFIAGVFSCHLISGLASLIRMHDEPFPRIWGNVLYTGLIFLFGVLALGTKSDWAGMGLTIAAALGLFLSVTGVLDGGSATAKVMALAFVGGVLAWRGAERP